MSGAFHSSPHRPGSGNPPGHTSSRTPSSRSHQNTNSTSGLPRFQSLTRIANQNTSGGSSGSGGEEQLRRRSMERPDGPYRKRRWSGEKLRYEDNLGCAVHDQHPPFFVPSYLRESRFVERLKHNWEAHLAELEEGKGGREDQRTARKAAGPHRGVAQDLVERPPAGLLSGAHSTHSTGEEEDLSRGLPSRWSEDDKWTGLEVLGDGSEVRFAGVCKTSDEAASIRTDHPMPIECGLYYFEVTILSRCKEGLIGIGFSGKKTPLNRLPGWEAESWAYHGDDGYSFACSANGKGYGPKFVSQDVIGCGLNFRTGQAFFTKNGVHLGVAFSGLQRGIDYYPSIGIKKSGEHLRANFGRNRFAFDIDGMMAEERRWVRNQINSTAVKALHPPDDENTLIQKLVGQYLAHEGYVETSKAFAADVQDRAKSRASDSAGGSTEPLASVLGSGEDDVHTMNRQKIRRAILDGDIDRALKFTHSFYPLVLQDKRNEEIYFQLRCRKFVEMMRRYSELQVVGTASERESGSGSGINGHAQEDDNQMELDDQLNRESTSTLKQDQDQEQSQSQQPSDDVDMDTSTSSLPKSGLMKSNDYLTAALQYGQELQAEFGADARPAVKEKLREVFAIMAYVDPRESIVGGLLDKRGRVGIAEGINGAILVSLGKPSSAALEKLCAQTEAFLDAAAAKGIGKAGLVNVREDFLRPPLQ